jgi:hypothetical protein
LTINASNVGEKKESPGHAGAFELCASCGCQ